MSGPYWNGHEPDMPDYQRPILPATCLLCGFEATTSDIWLMPAWWRESVDGQEVTTVPRCRQTEDCRARVAANGETWPLLERGEQPGGGVAPSAEADRERPRLPFSSADPKSRPPVESTEPDQPAPKEASRVDWF